MKRSVTAFALALAFAAGFGVAHMSSPATAASAPLTAQAIDLGAVTLGELAPAGGAFGAKPLLTQDGMTLGVQIGPVAKHYHADANEIQYVVEGTGTEWLGDTQVNLRPGTLLIIPKGTTHGGSVETTGHLKLIAIKTPPQLAGDTHPVP